MWHGNPVVTIFNATTARMTSIRVSGTRSAHTKPMGAQRCSRDAVTLNLNMKNFVNPFHAAASFCGARPGNIRTNAFFCVTTHRISHSTGVSALLLLNDVAPVDPVVPKVKAPLPFRRCTANQSSPQCFHKITTLQEQQL
jgi:hypothetical protein